MVLPQLKFAMPWSRLVLLQSHLDADIVAGDVPDERGLLLSAADAAYARPHVHHWLQMRNESGQVFHTLMPLSPNNII